MDPKACLKRLLEAIMNHDADEAELAASDLRAWLQRGGALPSPQDCRAVCQEIAAAAIAPAPVFAIGDRVRLVRTLEVFNLGNFPADAAGTVLAVNPDANVGEPIVEVEMDTHFSCLEQWDNVLQIFRADEGEVSTHELKPE